MRVLFLQRQPCIRALKIAAGLRSRPGPLHLSFAFQGRTLSAWYGTGDELFDEWIDLGRAAEPRDELARAIERARPDVIHSHNLPDVLTVLALETAGGRVPVVHDAHDLQSLRRTPYNDGFPEPARPAELERLAVEGCAALVTVSDEVVAAIAARHRLPGRVVVFPNYALAADLPRPAPETPERVGTPRLVYQGSLGTDGGHYDLRGIFAELVAAGLRLDVHPARPAPEYEALAQGRPGLTVHAPLPPADLLAALPRYDLGWAGFNATLNRAHIDTALPNKAFEYLASGLPLATLGHRALVRLIEEEGVGVSVDRPADLPARLAQTDLAAIRRRVLAARDRCTVEGAIGCVRDLYRDLVGTGARSGSPAGAQAATSASGRTGEPVAPTIFSGAQTKLNSTRSAAASSSSARFSRM